MTPRLVERAALEPFCSVLAHLPSVPCLFWGATPQTPTVRLVADPAWLRFSGLGLVADSTWTRCESSLFGPAATRLVLAPRCANGLVSGSWGPLRTVVRSWGCAVRVGWLCGCLRAGWSGLFVGCSGALGCLGGPWGVWAVLGISLVRFVDLLLASGGLLQGGCVGVPLVFLVVRGCVLLGSQQGPTPCREFATGCRFWGVVGCHFGAACCFCFTTRVLIS